MTLPVRPTAVQTSTNLFKLMQENLGHNSDKMRVTAENIENLNTPGYKEKEVVPFKQSVYNHSLKLVRTQPGHLKATKVGFNHVRLSHEKEEDFTGNNVNYRKQMMIGNEAGSNHLKVTNMYRAYVEMLDKALSVGGLH